MKKLTIGLLAALLAGLFALPSIANAQEAAPLAGDTTIEGRGWLYANGTGDVDIEMGGRIRLRVEGDVAITDNSGDMRVRLRGHSQADEEERSTNVTLSDFRGFINVRGSDFTVSVDGQVLLNAHGRGEANLVGDGVYKTRNGVRTPWDGMVHLGDPQVQLAG